MASITQARRTRVAALRGLRRELGYLESASRRAGNRLDGRIKLYAPPSGVSIPAKRGLPDFEILTLTSEDLEDILDFTGELAQKLERAEQLFREPV